MPIDLHEILAPSQCALVMNECQSGVIGRHSNLPALAESAAKGLIPKLAELCAAARRAGVLVVHGIAERRPDGRGANRNARLFQYAAKSPVQLTPGTEATRVVPEIGVEEGDLVLPRLHGLSPFQGTELDSILRNEGIRTVVAAGVSVNVAVTNLCFDAVNAAYQVVVPRDAVAGVPADYVDSVLENTLATIATVSDTASILPHWSA